MNTDTEELFGTHMGLEEEDARFSWERNYPGDTGNNHIHEPSVHEHIPLRGGAPTGSHFGSAPSLGLQDADGPQVSPRAKSGQLEQNGLSAGAEDKAQASPGPNSNGVAKEVQGGSDTDTDDEETVAQRQQQQQQAEAARMAAAAAASKPPAAVAPKKRPPGKSRPSGGITLRLLMEEGILEAGEDVLTVEYKSQTTKGTLTEDGRIQCRINGQNQTFESPSAFSIFLKRLINPSRKADDGWKTVKYGGKFLDHYKLELARRRFPTGKPSPSEPGGSAGPGEDNTLAGPAAKKPRLDPSSSQQPTGLGQGTNHATQNGHDSDVPMQRPRRQTKTPAWMTVRPEDEHQMVPCQQYGDAPPGSQEEGAQPFKLEVSPTALLVMDYHAHLNMNEIIGFLGGSYDEERRVMRVLKAYPVKELQTEDDRINVEMDPEDDFQVRQLIEKDNLRCMGWYHSHPRFETLPSLVDIGNQVAQQHAHRCDSGHEPYVGAIVGPYGKSDHQDRPDVSSIDWFYVDHPPGRIPANEEDPLQAGCRPMQLQVTEVATMADGMTVVQLPQGELQQLALRYAPMPTRADLRGSWREGRSRLQKLKESIAARLPAGWQVKLRNTFLQAVEFWTKSAFSKFPQAKGSQQATYDWTSNPSHHSRPVAEDDPEISDVSDDEKKPAPSDHHPSPPQHRTSHPVMSEGPSHSGRHGSGALEPPGPIQDEEPFDPRRFYEDSPRAEGQPADRGGSSDYALQSGVDAGYGDGDADEDGDEELSDPGSADTQEKESALPAPAASFHQRLTQASASADIGQSISEDEPEAEDEASDDSEATN
ncbi:hypothetical protein WJX74_002471 [Apatococcus lobatus]|uniref:MPN domain-containing protein n=1 Tax=Apatococcus lobatus TaxID=904363 RepID=A0AAW1Q8P6_9CHLO